MQPSYPRLFLITGCPGAGKTTTCEALLQRFPLGLRISVDDLRDQVVSGMAHPIPEWTDAADLQFNLARKSAAAMAHIYLEAGFAVAIDDTIPPHKADNMLAPLSDWRPVRVLLVPPLETCLHRNATRTNKNFDTGLLGEAIKHFHPGILEDHKDATDYVRIDTSAMTPEEVAKAILSKVGE